jgi:hypothetical protein
MVSFFFFLFSLLFLFVGCLAGKWEIAYGAAVGICVFSFSFL